MSMQNKTFETLFFHVYITFTYVHRGVPHPSSFTAYIFLYIWHYP